jgi:thiol-disulfide isomerase/thioredoxin
MNVENITNQDFNQYLESNDKVVVKYYADWCGACKMVSPKYKRLSNDDRFGGISFVEVNAEQNEAARKAGGVDNLPFFAVFKNGELVEGSATSKEDYIVAMLDKLNA